MWKIGNAASCLSSVYGTADCCVRPGRWMTDGWFFFEQPRLFCLMRPGFGSIPPLYQYAMLSEPSPIHASAAHGGGKGWWSHVHQMRALESVHRSSNPRALNSHPRRSSIPSRSMGNPRLPSAAKPDRASSVACARTACVAFGNVFKGHRRSAEE